MPAVDGGIIYESSQLLIVLPATDRESEQAIIAQQTTHRCQVRRNLDFGNLLRPLRLIYNVLIGQRSCALNSLNPIWRVRYQNLGEHIFWSRFCATTQNAEKDD